jgi:hypothetical protein
VPADRSRRAGWLAALLATAGEGAFAVEERAIPGRHGAVRARLFLPAGRPRRAILRERTAFVLSIGGHGDLSRTLRYLCTDALADGVDLLASTSLTDAEARPALSLPEAWKMVSFWAALLER